VAADVILLFHRGRLVEFRAHSDLVRHGALYAELYEGQFLTAGAESIPSEHQIAWYGCLEQELDNLRAARAASHADTSGAEPELRLAGALGRFWHIRAPGAEGRAWLAEALHAGRRMPAPRAPAR
jgi:hypothetical protein